MLYYDLYSIIIFYIDLPAIPSLIKEGTKGVVISVTAWIASIAVFHSLLAMTESLRVFVPLCLGG